MIFINHIIIRYPLVIFLVIISFFCSCGRDDKSKDQNKTSNKTRSNPLDSIVKKINSLNGQIKLEEKNSGLESFPQDTGKVKISLKRLKKDRQYALESFYGPNDVVPLPSPEKLPAKINSQSHLVCAIIPISMMNKSGKTYVLTCPLLKEMKFKDCPKGFCEDETYLDEINPSICTGFSFKDDILITAGHCVSTTEEAKNFYYVFNFIESKSPLIIPEENVFTAVNLVPKKPEDDTLDFTLIKVDRKLVSSLTPFISSSSSLDFTDKFYMLGHPIGLPMKYTPNGKVFFISSHYVLTNLDAYGGNSGSPVFNETSNRFEGILLKGLPDFITTEGNCKKSAKYDINEPKKSFTGETVLRINKLLNKY